MTTHPVDARIDVVRRGTSWYARIYMRGALYGESPPQVSRAAANVEAEAFRCAMNEKLRQQGLPDEWLIPAREGTT